MNVNLACDCCGTTQQAPLPTKQVLLNFRLSLPKTITNLVERLASLVEEPDQRREDIPTL